MDHRHNTQEWPQKKREPSLARARLGPCSHVTLPGPIRGGNSPTPVAHLDSNVPPMTRQSAGVSFRQSLYLVASSCLFFFFTSSLRLFSSLPFLSLPPSLLSLSVCVSLFLYSLLSIVDFLFLSLSPLPVACVLSNALTSLSFCLNSITLVSSPWTRVMDSSFRSC